MADKGMFTELMEAAEKTERVVPPGSAGAGGAHAWPGHAPPSVRRQQLSDFSALLLMDTLGVVSHSRLARL